MDTKKETLTQSDRRQEFENRTIEFHKRVATSFLKMIREINQGNETLDPSGWGVYGFDKSRVTPEQVQDIGPGSDVEPTFEMHYFPSDGENEVQERRRGEMITFISDTNPNVQVNVQFLPMNSGTVTFSEAEIPLPSYIQKRNYHIAPAVISVVKHDDDPYINEGVVLQGVAPTQTEESLQMAEEIMFEANRIVEGIENGQYHMRIFGSSSNSPMSPRFIIQQERLDKGNS